MISMDSICGNLESQRTTVLLGHCRGIQDLCFGPFKAGRTPRHLQDIGHLALNLGRALLTDSEALAPWSGSARSKHISVPRSSEPSGPLSKKRRRWPGSLKVDWTSTCSWHFKASMLAAIVTARLHGQMPRDWALHLPAHVMNRRHPQASVPSLGSVS